MDAAAALQKARAAIKDAEASIAKLRTDRVNAMLGPEEAIVQIDDKILAAQKAVGLQLDRCKAFVGELRRIRHEQRLRDREVFLAAKEKELAKGQKLFEAVEQDAARLGASVRKAWAWRAEFCRDWPENLCRLPGDYDLRFEFARQNLAADFRNPVPDHLGVHTRNMAARVREAMEAYFVRARASSLPPDDEDNEEQAA